MKCSKRRQLSALLSQQPNQQTRSEFRLSVSSGFGAAFAIKCNRRDRRTERGHPQGFQTQFVRFRRTSGARWRDYPPDPWPRADLGDGRMMSPRANLTCYAQNGLLDQDLDAAPNLRLSQIVVLPPKPSLALRAKCYDQRAPLAMRQWTKSVIPVQPWLNP